MSSSPTSHTFFRVISRFLLVNLSKFGAGMLIKCCILPSRNIKSAKASGALLRTPLGKLTALPQTPYWIYTNFTPICSFHRSQLYANIVIPSLLNEDLHPLDKEGFNGMGPGIDLRTPWKSFSLMPCQ